ncbi:bifunctional protein-serine/threonine kinase/phosphatase [Azohydromonas lata]|uniref:Bifunctional protein-serine/threonine kinase/phosphatase n=1 Tax=Azohydromonas lata TaxID=45677 RepID=A0ABU5IC09_9BURK|nr:bifunctional protein-serine/threonine kinase/phosphatase [Azohydromonas lata]MDZ5456626.1 bifunctional protein-serine/threonine kinase/phosphatase [Azohydromonas lata]
MSFEVDIGHASRRGPREINEDFAGALRERRGLVAAIADGVSTGGGGREAAQTSVMGLLSDFFAAPATWDTTVVLDRLIAAQNNWLVAVNRQRQVGGGWHRREAGRVAEPTTALTTLTALALEGRGYTVAHVGDTRAWLLSGGELAPLTQDHAFDHPDQRSRLTRAVGLDEALSVDYAQGPLRVGDVFVLTTDGVHGVLKRARLAELAAKGSAQEASDAIVEAAIAAGGRDNASALVVRVLGLDAGRLEDELARSRQLPVPGRLKVGDRLDGFTITALVADSGVHRLYQARSPQGTLVALKTLHEARASDPEERAMLAHEAWLGLRLAEADAPGFIRVHEVRNASALYTVFDWHGGRTLEQWLKDGQRFGVDEVVRGAVAITRAVGRLHRLGVVHRDLKPGNLHLGEDGQWRLLDLGTAVSAHAPAAQRELHAGTPSFMNPEQWEGAAADSGSDLFALGATLYLWLGGHLPYGEVEPYQTARFRRDPRPLSRLRPDVPIWLDHLVLKAVARDPRQRFETAEELLLALQRGASRSLGAPTATPLAVRDPLALWKAALVVSLLFNLLLVVWLLFLPR